MSMQTLSNYEPDRKTLKFKKLELVVRGITTDDMSYLLSKNLIDIQLAFEDFQKAGSGLMTTAGLDAYLMRMTRACPVLVAEIISVACDEPDAVDRARTLPLAVQITALTEIVALTFEEAGGLKNWFASLALTINGLLPESLAKALVTLKERGLNGSIGTLVEK